MNDRSTVEGRRTRRVLITRCAALAASLVAAPTLLRAQQKFTCGIAHSDGSGTPITLACE